MSRSWLVLAVLALLALSLFVASPVVAKEAEAEDEFQMADFELELEEFGADNEGAMMLEADAEAEGEDALDSEAQFETELDSEADAETETEVDAEEDGALMEAEAEAQAAPQYTYSQRTGIFRFPDGKTVQCYAGHGSGVNNPNAQCQSKVGPVPRGTYTIGARFNNAGSTGPNSMRLTPSPRNAMCGRSAFLIHGGTFTSAKSGPSSEGCIIMPVNWRTKIQAGGILTVTV